MQRRHKLFSVSPFSPIFLLYVVVVLALLGCVAAKPAPVGMRRTTETVYRRQAGDPTKQAVTVQTVQVTNTTLGPVTETCQITLSPAKGHKNLVKEVKQCTYSMGANNAGSGGAADSSASASATDSASATASATDSAASAASTTDASSTVSAASSADASASSVSASSSAAASAVSSAATASVAAPAVSANGVSSVPLASVAALAGSSSAAVSSAAVSSAAVSSATVSSAADSTSAAATAAGAVASDNASATAAPDLASASASASASPAAAFQIPGKKLSVLPIGLGIFAGISVIALIVVGLVTYERTKYRKAFRQRKLAEQGQSMGYGGMAQQAA